MTTRFASLALFLVGLVACGGGTATDGPEPQPTPSSSSPSPSSPSAPAAEDDPIVGTYHLSQVDATNLQLKADKTFTWTIEGCDFGGGQCGTWTRQPNGDVVLKGADGKTLEWSYDGSFKQSMSSVKVKLTREGVEVHGVTKQGDTFTQTWDSGRSCAKCGGQLGPTGQEACDEPLPNVCAR